MAKIIFNSMPKVERFLRSRGIDKRYIFAIRNALITDALTQADGLTVARFYTAFGLALHDDYGFGQERLQKVYTKVGDLMGAVGDGKTDWHTEMERLKDTTGLIINVDPEWSEIELPEEGETE